MKFRCPRREIREEFWHRVPTPNCTNGCVKLKAKLRQHDSSGHYWHNTIFTHFWIEKEDDYIWFLMTCV